jgi:hypothetical protein
MIPGGEMIGIHAINIASEWHPLSKGGEIIQKTLKGIQTGGVAPRRVQEGGQTPRRELPFAIDVKGGEIIQRNLKGIQIGGVAPRRVQEGGETPRRELPFSIDVKGGEIITLMRRDEY